MKVSLTLNLSTYPICERVFKVIVHGVRKDEGYYCNSHLAQEEY